MGTLGQSPADRVQLSVGCPFSSRMQSSMIAILIEPDDKPFLTPVFKLSRVCLCSILFPTALLLCVKRCRRDNRRQSRLCSLLLFLPLNLRLFPLFNLPQSRHCSHLRLVDIQQHVEHGPETAQIWPYFVFLSLAVDSLDPDESNAGGINRNMGTLGQSPADRIQLCVGHSVPSGMQSCSQARLPS